MIFLCVGLLLCPWPHNGNRINNKSNVYLKQRHCQHSVYLYSAIACSHNSTIPWQCYNSPKLVGVPTNRINFRFKFQLCSLKSMLWCVLCVLRNCLPWPHLNKFGRFREKVPGNWYKVLFLTIRIFGVDMTIRLCFYSNIWSLAYCHSWFSLEGTNC